jgi:tetratricopeptide (TPR) repeat protein
LQRCLVYDPTMADAYEALGVILSRQQRYPEAIALMEQLLTLEPERHMAHTNLSIYYMHLGDKDRAEEEKAKATMVAMQAAMRKKMQETVSQQQVEQARQAREQAILDRIGLFHDALKFNAEDALTNFGLGSAYLELQRYPEAIPPLERAIAGQPNHSVAYLSLGKALEATQQMERAQEVYQQGIAVAARKGDRMPLQEMEQRLAALTHSH